MTHPGSHQWNQHSVKPLISHTSESCTLHGKRVDFSDVYFAALLMEIHFHNLDGAMLKTPVTLISCPCLVVLPRFLPTSTTRLTDATERERQNIFYLQLQQF